MTIKAIAFSKDTKQLKNDAFRILETLRAEEFISTKV